MSFVRAAIEIARFHPIISVLTSRLLILGPAAYGNIVKTKGAGFSAWERLFSDKLDMF